MEAANTLLVGLVIGALCVAPVALCEQSEQELARIKAEVQAQEAEEDVCIRAELAWSDAYYAAMLIRGGR